MSLVSSSPIALCIAASLFLSSIRSDAQVSSPNITFKFFLSAVSKIIENGQPQIVPLKDNMVLRSGNLIKFYLVLENEGYLYLFHEDSRGDFARLFPKDSKPALLQPALVYVPEANSWIELDSNIYQVNFTPKN